MCKTKPLKANTREIITVKCVWHQICTKSLLWRQMLGKLLPKNACGTTYVQNHYFEGKCQGHRYLKINLTPNMSKIITVKANAKESVTLKCIWHHLCTKSLLWRQMPRKSLLENAFGTTYVQNCYIEGKCSGNHYFKMHLTPNMYKMVTLQGNAKDIITWTCVWHHICTKSLLWR